MVSDDGGTQGSGTTRDYGNKPYERVDRPYTNKRDPNTSTQMLVKGLLSCPSAVLIGSRGFDVHKDELTDYDIAILEKDLPKVFDEKYKRVSDIHAYMKVMPMLNNDLMRLPKDENGPGLDIIIYKSESHIFAIKKAMDEIKYQVPKYMLANKHIRVVLFEEILIMHGFERVE